MMIKIVIETIKRLKKNTHDSSADVKRDIELIEVAMQEIKQSDELSTQAIKELREGKS